MVGTRPPRVYCSAVLRLVVVLISPTSHPPLTPRSSDVKNLLGIRRFCKHHTTPSPSHHPSSSLTHMHCLGMHCGESTHTAMPLYTILPVGRGDTTDNFMIPLTTAVIVFTYVLPWFACSSASGNLLSAALYLMYCIRDPARQS
eukprot:2812889-Rhodomonas_salina.1